MSDINANTTGEDEEILVIDGLGNRTYAFTRRAIKHMLIGAGLGFLLSLTLSSILYESARNVMFCVLDIIILLAAAIALFLKQEKAVKNSTAASSAQAEAASQNLLSFDKPWERMLAVVRIGGLICACAAFCSILVIATSIPPALKMFFVMTISTAHCFLLCLGCVEIFNAFFNNGANLIARQVYTVAFCSVAVGCLSGFMFGAVDVENDIERLRWEEWVTASLCIFSGAMIGHANAYASNDDEMEIAFDPLPMDENANNGDADDNIDPYNNTNNFTSTSPTSATSQQNNNNNNNNTTTTTTAARSSAANTTSTNASNMDDFFGSGLGGASQQQQQQQSGHNDTDSAVSLATINFPNSSPSLVPKNKNNNNNNSNDEGNNNDSSSSPSVPKPDW